MALTSDLLYKIWSYFQQDVNGKSLNIPWVAVADLILCSLCSAVSSGLYEMDQIVCQEILKYAQADERLGAQRIQELSDFVVAYTEPDIDNSDAELQDLARTRRWRALAYTKPKRAANNIASAQSYG